jgi:hypothetical protein
MRWLAVLLLLYYCLPQLIHISLALLGIACVRRLDPGSWHFWTKISFRARTNNLTAVVEKLTAEVRYLFPKNRLSCHFKGHFFRRSKDVCLSLEAKCAPRRYSVQKSYALGNREAALLSGYSTMPVSFSERMIFETTTNWRLKTDKADFRWLQKAAQM